MPTRYPPLASPGIRHPWQVGAAFTPPAYLPPGRYDLALIVNGRADTAVLEGAVRLLSPHITAMHPSGAGPGPAGKASLAGALPSGFRLFLPKSAEVDLLALDGRRLFRFGNLGPGTHSLPRPASSPGSSLLLCRVRHADGVAWLRVMPTL